MSQPVEHAHLLPGPDGELRLVRNLNGRPTSGRVVQMRDGESLTPGTELITIQHLGGSCVAVRSIYKRASTTSQGPAQVATDSYRSNWDTIWGKRDVN